MNTIKIVNNNNNKKKKNLWFGLLTDADGFLAGWLAGEIGGRVVVGSVARHTFPLSPCFGHNHGPHTQNTGMLLLMLKGLALQIEIRLSSVMFHDDGFCCFTI